MRKYIKFLFALSIVFTGCTKGFLDINDNPNNPSAAPVNFILPQIESTLGYALSYGGGHADDCARMMQHLSERANLWALNGNSVVNWNYIYYSPIEDIEFMIKSADKDGNTYYAGIGKILKAYAYSILVDLYGDVPFSEANQLNKGIYYPKFDGGATIYPQLFTLLDAGIADLQVVSAPGQNILVPGANDVIYGGDKQKWIRAAKTIKLKMYTQIRLVQDVKAATAALLTEGDLIKSGEDFVIPYGTSQNPDMRNQGYLEYTVGQKGQYICPWMYEIMSGRNPAIFAGYTDPRRPYYWYNQMTASSATREGNPTEYRAGGFVSIYPGSIGKNRDFSTDGSMSVLGIYPVGGRYDNGGAAKINATSGSGAAPLRLLTYADRLFLTAELYNQGIVTGDARTAYQNAITASFALVDKVVTASQPALFVPAETVPVISTLATTTSYIANMMTLWDAATPTRRLEYIMTQKWIEGFGWSIDNWADYRRTGYPILFDPRNPVQAPNGFVTNPDTNVDSPGYQKLIPVQRTNDVELSLPFPQLELSLNANAPDQKVPSTFKVFWMP